MIQLTKYAAKGGCACKIGPHILARVLQGVQLPTSDKVLVDMSGADDAGVYKLDDKQALVQTLDFFTPIVDDPELFGRIAAANSVSDVYAMGGTPITAMNIVGFPVPLVEQGALTAVLNGAADVLREAGVADSQLKEAVESDWSEEFLAPIIAVKVVNGLDAAIEHINRYSSGHTEAIVSENYTRAMRFLREVDSASVMINASTRFADGFEYGLGAEIGISTDKIHARGPVGLEGLTSQKWIVFGDGQVRG